MSFVRPMLASPWPDRKDPFSLGAYVAEEKYDGIRIIYVKTEDDGYLDGYFYSRYGNVKSCPRHIGKALEGMPVGVFDGELYVPGKRSYGAADKANEAELMLVLFDVLEVNGLKTLDLPWTDRRALLEETARQLQFGVDTFPVGISQVFPVSDETSARQIAADIMARDGEGIILKRTASRYLPNKRAKDWIKIKGCKHALLEVVGFKAGRGEKINRGPYATVILEDADGNQTTVKTKNDYELAKFESEAPSFIESDFELVPSNQNTQHPAIGRKLWIEYQERTPDGLYRHPMWDRWEVPRG
jgi:ATP-dependent DNA ligase